MPRLTGGQTVKKYIILYDSNKDFLQKNVMYHMEFNYVLYGSPFFGNDIFYQAMVQYNS